MHNWQPVIMQEAVMVIDFLTKWIIMIQKKNLKIVLDEDDQVKLTIKTTKSCQNEKAHYNRVPAFIFLTNQWHQGLLDVGYEE